MTSPRRWTTDHSNSNNSPEVKHMAEPVAEPKAVQVRDSDLLRVLVALAGRIAFPPEQLVQIVGPYSSAYNMCTGELTLASIARATGFDKSNLRKAILRWEEAGAIFRVGPEGLPLRLYALPPRTGDRVRGESRSGDLLADSVEPLNGGADGQEER
jgi:hypothetical protein